MSIIHRAAKALPRRLRDFASYYFDPQYMGQSGRASLPYTYASPRYGPQPDGGFGPVLDENGNQVYDEQNGPAQLCPEVVAFLNAYDVATARTALGIKASSGNPEYREGHVQQSGYVEKPAGAANEVAVPFGGSFSLPQGVTWTAADPTWIYFDETMTTDMAPVIRSKVFNGTPGQDYIRTEFQRKLTADGPYEGDLAGSYSGAGAIRIGSSMMIQEEGIRSFAAGVRMRLLAGSYAAAGFTLISTDVKFKYLLENA